MGNVKRTICISVICCFFSFPVHVGICQDYTTPEMKKILEKRVINNIVKTFYLGILKQDPELIKKSIIPNQNADVLWNEDELDPDIKRQARKIVGHLSILHLEPGDIISLGDEREIITTDHVNRHQRLLAIDLGGMSTFLYVRRYRGQWRLDANLFIQMYLWAS